MQDCFITIGDWSGDGHGRREVFTYRANRSIADQQAAFHRMEAHSGLMFIGTQRDPNDPNAVCLGYQDGMLSTFHMTILHRRYAIDRTPFGDEGLAPVFPHAQWMAKLILWLIGCELPGFEHDAVSSVKMTSQTRKDNLEQMLNGWWGALNGKIGYGLYNRRYTADRSPRPLLSPSEKVAMLTKSREVSIEGYDWDVIRTDILGLYREGARAQSEGITEWLHENVQGSVIWAGWRFLFQRQEDAALFKLANPFPGED